MGRSLFAASFPLSFLGNDAERSVGRTGLRKKKEKQNLKK
jgi:hypothetical protein